MTDPVRAVQGDKRHSTGVKIVPAHTSERDGLLDLETAWRKDGGRPGDPETEGGSINYRTP